MSFRLLFAAVFSFNAGLAAAREIYVSNIAGDDRYTGAQSQPTGDGTGPVESIAKAVRLATAGDKIILIKTDKPYRECVVLSGWRHSGYPHQSFTIQGNGNVLDGTMAIPPQAWENYRGPVFRFRPPRTGYQQLYLEGIPAVQVPAPEMPTDVPELKPREWCLAGGAIYFCVEKNKTPRDYSLRCASLQTGITLYQVDYVAISDLTVQGFVIDGISAINTARHVYLSNIISRGNGRSGVTVGGASSLEVDVSLLGNNGHAQLLTLPWSETTIRNSVLLGNTAPGWVDRGNCRVWLGDERVSGGRERIEPAAEPEPEKKP